MNEAKGELGLARRPTFLRRKLVAWLWEAGCRSASCGSLLLERHTSWRWRDWSSGDAWKAPAGSRTMVACVTLWSPPLPSPPCSVSSARVAVEVKRKISAVEVEDGTVVGLSYAAAPNPDVADIMKPVEAAKLALRLQERHGLKLSDAARVYLVPAAQLKDAKASVMAKVKAAEDDVAKTKAAAAKAAAGAKAKAAKNKVLATRATRAAGAKNKTKVMATKTKVKQEAKKRSAADVADDAAMWAALLKHMPSEWRCVTGEDVVVLAERPGPDGKMKAVPVLCASQVGTW